jgi:hypothetical protein
MQEKSMAQPLLSIIEARIRAFWTRLGAAVERSIGPGTRQSYDVNAILDAIERKTESTLRHQGNRLQLPDHVEVRFDYETYSRMSDLQRTHLIRELESSLKEFAHNRRYVTAAPIRVELAFDAFAKRLEVRTKFSDSVAVPTSVPSTMASLRLKPLSSQIAAKGEFEGAFDNAHRTLGLGRSRDNALVIDDASVSNFHASFTLNPDGSIWLADLGSSNGTEIDRVVLAANDRARVRDGSRIRFGDVEVTAILANLPSTS